MPKQLDTPAPVTSAAADYIATGSPEHFQRYEAALREWLFPPRVGSWDWMLAQRRGAVGSARNVQTVPPVEPPRYVDAAE